MKILLLNVIRNFKKKKIILKKKIKFKKIKLIKFNKILKCLLIMKLRKMNS